jgi:AAA ATPase domain
MASKDTGLIGRDGELSRLRGLLDRALGGPQALVLLGDPGMGKTVLLADAARHARSAGIGVLSVAGRESERDLAFAGLHQPLRPVLDRVAGLPGRQAEALRGAFALSADPVPPDALLTGIAVLTLLSGLSEDGPLLVVAVTHSGWTAARWRRWRSPRGAWTPNRWRCLSARGGISLPRALRVTSRSCCCSR